MKLQAYLDYMNSGKTVKAPSPELRFMDELMQ